MRAFPVFLIVAWTCGGAIAAGDDHPFVAAIHLQIDQSIAADVLVSALEAETESLWKPYGVQLEWTADRATETAALDISLDVIVERSIAPPPTSQRGTVLGQTFLELGSATHVEPIQISFDATERALAMRPITGFPTVRLVHQREVARALGRVLAHEIGHVLLGARYHDDAGLMRAVFRPFELADSNRAPFRLTDMSVARLDHRLRMLRGIAP